MQTYVAFIRGINVGGNHKVAMADLKAMLIDAGFIAPQTVLQSGNVAFLSPMNSSEEMKRDLALKFEARFGFKAEMHVRTSAELDEVIRACPWQNAGDVNPSHLITIFLTESIDETACREVGGKITGPEVIASGHRVLYVKYPDGIGTSTLDRTPGWRKLVADGTARNWNTLLKLKELCGKLQSSELG